MAGISLLANGTVTIDNRGSDVVSGQILPTVAIYPGSLRAASLSGDLIFTPDRTTTSAASLINLIPSRFGQMSLFAGGDIKPMTLVMEDRDPGQLPGLFSAFEVRKSVLTGRSVYVRVDLGGRRTIKKK